MIGKAPFPMRPAGLGLAMIACAVAPLSCTARQTREQQQLRATEGIDDPIRALQARAELEALNPLPAPSEELLRRLLGDTTEPLTPGSQAHQRAMRPADQIETTHSFDAAQPPPEPDATGKRHALKLYTRARVLHQQGQNEQAAEVLTQASQLDPASPTIMRALGDVLGAEDDAVGAANAYERAVELGDRTATPLIALASRAYALNDDQRVIALCTLALKSDEIAPDSPPAALAGIMLGNALIRQGYLRAGAESLQNALTAFEPSTEIDNRWRREIVQIMGRRAALWVVVGDAWSKVGAHPRAAEAYTQAAQLSEGVSADLATRRIVALLREGRPAGAGLMLIEHLRRYAHDLTPMEAQWMRTLAELPSLSPILHDAVGSLRRQGNTTPTERRALMRVEISGLDPDRALDRLAAGGPDANSTEALVDALKQTQGPQAQHVWATALLARNPHTAEAIAQAWSSLPTPLTERLGMFDTATPGGQLLAASLAMRMNRADLLPHLDALPQSSPDDAANTWIEVHAQAAATTGRWGLADSYHRALARRAEQGDRDAARRAAAVEIILQRPADALRRARELAGRDARSINDLLLLARVAITLEEHETAEDALVEAWELDPNDTRIADQLLRLRGSGAPLEDQQGTQDIIRTLGQNRPRSALFSLLRATDLARNGLMREAERAVHAINARTTGGMIGSDLVLSIWKTQQTQGQSDALQRGADWLRERLAQNPNDTGAAMALAQILYEQEEHELAERTLGTAWDHTGDFEIARVREQLLRNDLAEPGRADERARARLADYRGVNPTLEYARTLARTGDAADAEAALAALRERIPADAVLLPTQTRQLSQIVFALSEHAETPGIDPVMLELIALIEQRSGPLDFVMARTELLLLARAAEVDIDALLARAEAHARRMQDPEQAQTLRTLPVQVLLGEDRTHLAIAYTTRLALGDDTLDDDMLIEAFRLLGAAGVNSDLLGVLDALSEAGHLQAAIELTTERIGTPERDTDGLTEPQQRADLAYTAGALAAAFQRQDQSDAFMMLALSFDPEHAWSNNDLGYTLIERGERIEEAEKMLETAARVMPEQASIIDSLGWLRYKQGIYEDRIDEMTNTVIKRGAISLLSRANQLDRARTNATILLHLGDALWRADRREQALEAWLNAESMLRSRVRTLSAQPERNQGAIQAASEELRTLRYRIQDAEAGATPDIAPTFDDPGGN